MNNPRLRWHGRWLDRTLHIHFKIASSLLQQQMKPGFEDAGMEQCIDATDFVPVGSMRALYGSPVVCVAMRGSNKRI